MTLGTPRLHFRSTDSTNDRAKELAAGGAPHGTLVTADLQTAGRGRRGRSWYAPPGEALLMSLVLRDAPELTSLIAGLAVAGPAGPEAMIKWPNDVQVCGRKVAGVLIERRSDDDWTVVGIGVNVAVRAFPDELSEIAGSLGREPTDVEPFMASVLTAFERWLAADAEEVVAACRRRDALLDREVAWSGHAGIARGIDEQGRIVVALPDGATTALDAGEVLLRGQRVPDY